MKKNLSIFIFFAGLSAILSFIWFHSGLLVGLGESGVSFYNVKNQLAITGQTWTPFALGFFPGLTLCTLPLFYFAYFLSQLGFADYMVQAIIFGICVFLSFLGGALLSSYLLLDSKVKNVIVIFCGLFYALNFVALVTAWNRLQYPFLFFYLVIPYTLYIVFRACNEKKYIYALILNFIFLIFSTAFAAIPFIELIWGIVFSYVMYISLVYWKKDRAKLLFAWVFLALSLAIWILFNIWWLLQMVKAIEGVLGANVYSVKGDIGTLNALSQQQGNLSYVFRLMNQQFLLSMKSIWGNFYFSSYGILLSYVIPILTFMPLLFKKKPEYVYFFLGLSLFILYLIKGSSPPYGGLYLFLFSHFKILEVFRGSFEKFGLVLPLAYTPLIGYTTYVLITKLKQRYALLQIYLGFGIVALLLFGVLMFPFWNTWIFTYNLPPENNVNIGDYVDVPSDYSYANAFLHNDNDIFRGIALPIDGEGMTYTWKKGFNGVEYLNDMFGIPFISLGTATIPHLQNIADQMNYTLFKDPNSFSKMMSLLNVKYLLIRSDIDFKSRNTTNPKIIASYMQSNTIPNLTFQKQFGKLMFYKNTSLTPKIYAANNLFAAPENMFYSDVFALNQFKNHDIIVNTSNNKYGDFVANNIASSIAISPINNINTSTIPNIDLLTAESQIPQSRYGAGSKYFPLVQFKEHLDRWTIIDSGDAFLFDVNISYKRLGEFQQAVLAHNTDQIKPTADAYIKSLNFILQSIKRNNYQDLNTNLEAFRIKIISQQTIVDNLLSSVHDPSLQSYVKNIKESLTLFEQNTYVISLYPSTSKSSNNEEIYRFSVPQTENFQIALHQQDMQNYYTLPNNWQIQLNGIVKNVNIHNANGLLTFGTYSFHKGINEVHLQLPKPINLIRENTSTPVTLIANKKNNIIKKTFHLKNFDPYSTYKLSFDYKISNGGGVTVETESDVDSIIDGKTTPEWSQGISGSVNTQSWLHNSFTIYPYHNATTQTISFIITVTNSCIAQNQNDTFLQNKCNNDKNFSQKFDNETSFTFQNLKLESIFPTNLILFSQKKFSPTFVLPQIFFSEVNPAKYSVHIVNARQPFYLVFSENFNPDWQLEFANGSSATNNKHFLVNSYANAWYIDKKGTYTATIIFSDEIFFSLGKIISGVAIASSLLCIVIYIYKRRRG